MSSPPDVTMVSSSQLLREVSVFELSRHVAGAYCGTILAQLGAAVTRVDFSTSCAGQARTRRVLQHVYHRDKRKLPTGDRASIEAALSAAHIVVVEHDDLDDEFTRFASQVIDGHAALRPDATVLVLSASGRISAYQPGCGLTSCASAGLSWVIGEPGREPLVPPFDIIDYETGASAAAAGLVAFLANAGGSFRPVDVASRDVAAYFVRMLAHNYLPYGRPWRRDGRRPYKSGGVYPVGIFACKDGDIIMYCRSDNEWNAILRAMGNPPWSRDERFKDPRVVARLHADEVDTHLLPWLARHTKAELMRFSFEFGFPASPVRLVGEALDDPQFAFRGALEPVAIDSGTSVKVPTAPWLLWESRSILKTSAHTVAQRQWPVRNDVPRTPSETLNGLRVLDLSWVWSGPLVGSILADLGADVIKIEHPSHPDSLRQRGRTVRNGVEVEGPIAEINPWFNQLNHGKRSVIVDIKSADGRAQLLKLAASCDVVLENMRAGALEKLNLSYADLSAANSSIIMLSMSLAGQTGPLSDMKGYAGIMTAMAGLESLVGYEDENGAQIVVGMARTAFGDPNAATHALCVLLAALYRRKTTGRGLWIDLSQTQAILAILYAPLAETQLYGCVSIPGNQHPLHTPHGHFPCKNRDDWIALSIQTDEQWERFVKVINYGSIERFINLDTAGRRARRKEIEQAVAAWTSQNKPEDIVSVLSSARIAVARVSTYEDMMASAWKAQSGFSCTVDHPYIGEQEIALPPWHFGDQVAGAARCAPLLGAHTVDVLKSVN